MIIEIGDLVQEICRGGISLGIVQEISKEPGKQSNAIVLSATYNTNLVWNTYDWVISFNYGKMTVAEVREKYPERFI